MVPSDWDSAPMFVYCPNFTSDLIGESPNFFTTRNNPQKFFGSPRHVWREDKQMRLQTQLGWVLILFQLLQLMESWHQDVGKGFFHIVTHRYLPCLSSNCCFWWNALAKVFSLLVPQFPFPLLFALNASFFHTFAGVQVHA